MKIVLLALVFLGFIQQETPRLNGKYRTEFDLKYVQQNYQISFKDSTFVKKMPDAVTYKGKIAYGKFRATIKQNADDDPMEIDNREFGKDTIAFTVKSKRDNSRVAGRGILIRVKQ